jgi:hypothetical protein
VLAYTRETGRDRRVAGIRFLGVLVLSASSAGLVGFLPLGRDERHWWSRDGGIGGPAPLEGEMGDVLHRSKEAVNLAG